MANKEMNVKVILPSNFTPASNRTNIAASDNIVTAMSKSAKYFNDLQDVAFTGSYANLSGTPDLSLKANKSETVSNVSYNTTNKKLTQTINGTTTDIVTTAKLKEDMNIPSNIVNSIKGDAESDYRTGDVIITKANIGLGNVGNFKAVSTVASQGLTTTEQSNARTNIGLGTSSTHNVPTSGNAGDSEVVLGNDSRLSNARTPTAHNQASNTINAMTGYSKPSSSSAISASDTLNGAVGKLEKGLDNKVDKETNKELMPSDMLENSKISTAYIPDFILGQLLYGGTVSATNVATLTNGAKAKLNTTNDTITLTNDTTAVTGYVANEGIYYVATGNATIASLGIVTGDWLISTGSAWKKVDNTDAVTGIKGNSESSYRTGNVNITAANVGAEPAFTKSTAFNKNFETSTSNIKMNGTVSVGSLTTVARADHIHPTDTTRAAKTETVTSVSYDTTNKKITKTINGTTTDVVTTATLKSDMDVPNAMTGATSSANGTVGYVNAVPPKDGYNTKYLRADGTWTVPPNTNTDRYVNSASFADDTTNSANSPVKMTLTRAGSDSATITGNIPKVSSASAGVVPKGTAVSSQSQTTKFLREDGTWAAPSYTTNTDTKVTSSANHYAPTTASGSDKTASASGATAEWSIDVVKGVTLNTDGKGHITGLSVTSGKIPANPNTDTKVTSVNNHYAPAEDAGAVISKDASSTTAATWNSTSLVTGVDIKRDAKGHVVDIALDSIKMPANPNTWTAMVGATSSANGTVGYVNAVPPKDGYNTKYLRADGTWVVPPDTDTKVTSSANHYAPTTVSGQDKTASASGATAAWEIDVVKGVTLNTDGKGHVTGLSVTSGKIPANPNIDTKVTQTADDSTNSNFEVIFSNTADNTTRTETSKKSSKLKFNPSTGNLQTTQLNGVTIGSSPKFTDTTYSTVSKTATGLCPQLPNETTTTKYLRQDGTWQVPPDNNTNYYHTSGSWSGLKYTATANGGAGELSFTIPTGTSATTVCAGNDSRLSDARTPTSHNQASNTINAMTSYSKPSSTSAITTSDTLNGAIGKLEKGLDIVNATIGDINTVLEEVL